MRNAQHVIYMSSFNNFRKLEDSTIRMHCTHTYVYMQTVTYTCTAYNIRFFRMEAFSSFNVTVVAVVVLLFYSV